MATTALTGTVERYISPPREEGFAILSIALPGGKRAKVCGKGLAGLAAGQTVELVGQWTTHPRFGKQFRAADIKATQPEDGAGLIRWLAEAAVPGVGEATARKLVQTFGRDTVERIASADPTAVALLGNRFADAQRAMIASRAEAAFGAILAEHDIGPATRQKIFAKYGMETARKIEEDPYRLICDIEGIAFATADRIAKATGVETGQRSRIVAAALDSLRSASNDGHTAVDDATLQRMNINRTASASELVADVIADIGHPSAVRTTLVDDNGATRQGWAMRSLDRAEERIANAVLDKVDQPSLLTHADARHYVARAAATIGIELNREQQAGAEMALANSISILNGPPGTGKTTILRVVCVAWRLAAADGWVDGRIKLGAPTGKAAQRMKQATDVDASTIHRLLEVDGETGGFLRNEENPLEAGLIAIDEASMKDALLASSLTRAWGRASILLIGDNNQLASVGAGRVLGDLIDSGVVPTTTLVTIRRQAEGSEIAEGARAIREGRMPDMGSGDLLFIEKDDADEVATIIADLHGKFVEDGMDVQVLTPGHNGETGTSALNATLQQQAGLEGEEIGIAAGVKARTGDKVLQVINDNEIAVFNGDGGRMGAIDPRTRSATVHLGDRQVEMSGDALRHLALAYALTVHKSQGSEFEVVIIPMTTSHWPMLKRTLFYTGITRARKLCIVVGSRKAVERAIATDDGNSRTTTLKHRLRAMAA